MAIIKLRINPPLVCCLGASLKGNPNLNISANNIYTRIKFQTRNYRGDVKILIAGERNGVTIMGVSRYLKGQI